MTKASKVYNKIMSGASDQNIMFDELISMMVSLGFSKRIKGSHHILYKNGIEEIINIQAKSDNKAKAYQVKQVRNIIFRYNIKLESL